MGHSIFNYLNKFYISLNFKLNKSLKFVFISSKRKMKKPPKDP